MGFSAYSGKFRVGGVVKFARQHLFFFGFHKNKFERGGAKARRFLFVYNLLFDIKSYFVNRKIVNENYGRLKDALGQRGKNYGILYILYLRITRFAVNVLLLGCVSQEGA